MKFNLKKSIISVIVIFIFAVGIYCLKTDVLGHFRMFFHHNNLRDWIMSFGKYSALIYILAQMVQAIVSFVPGEAIQIPGGFLFGLVYGTELSMLGIAIGSLVTFFIGRRFGEKLLKKILPIKHYDKVFALINRPQNQIIIFILYIMPGFPKDILGYVAGVTDINTKRFVIISNIARTPGVFVSVYFGSNLYHRNNMTLIAVAVMVVVLLTVIALNRAKIMEHLGKENIENNNFFNT